MMKMFTAGEGRKLKGILSKVTDPDCSFNPAQLHGFFFGLALTPEPVMPSEWLKVVFASDGPLFENEKDAQDGFGYLMEIYNRFITASNNDKLYFPFDYDKLTGKMLVDVEDWAHGLFEGLMLRPHNWGLTYEDSEGDIPEEILEVRDACAIISAIAFEEERSDLFELEPGEQPKSDEEIYVIIINALPDCVDILRDHAKVMREAFVAALRESSRETTVRSGPKVGRNDPCPCGSGRKYKKCCGAN